MASLDTVVVGGLINVPISRQLQASGVAPFTFAIVSGSLPSGLVLDSATGIVSGNASALFKNYITVRVTDDIAQFAERDILVEITDFAVVPLDQTGATSGNRPSNTLIWNLDGVLWQAACQRLQGPTRFVLGFWKSTDNGITWWPKGFSDPDFPNTTISTERSNFVVTYATDEELFYIAYPDEAGSLLIATFDPATYDWALQASAGGPTSVIRGYGGLMCSDGTLHVYYRRNGISIFDGQLYVSTWKAGSGWLVVDMLLSDTSAHPGAVPGGTIFSVVNDCNEVQLLGMQPFEADGVVQVVYVEYIDYTALPASQRKLHWRQLSLDAATWSADYIQPDTDHPRSDAPFIGGAGNLQSIVQVGRKWYSFFKHHPGTVSLRPAVFIFDLDTLEATFDDIFTTTQNLSDQGIAFIDPALPGRLQVMYTQRSNFPIDIIFRQYNDLAGAGWLPPHLHSGSGPLFTPTREVVYYGWSTAWPGELMAVHGNDPCAFSPPSSAPGIYFPRPIALLDGRIVTAVTTFDSFDSADRLVITTCEEEIPPPPSSVSYFAYN